MNKNANQDMKDANKNQSDNKDNINKDKKDILPNKTEQHTVTKTKDSDKEKIQQKDIKEEMNVQYSKEKHVNC